MACALVEWREHPWWHALVAALPPRRGQKLVSLVALDSDDDAFDGDSNEEVAVQEWALSGSSLTKTAPMPSPCIHVHAARRTAPASSG
jgi:hypothetical protein